MEDCISSIANPNDYICSNSGGVPSNAAYLLCPQDTTNDCRDIDEVIVNSSSTYNRSDTSIVDQDVICKYKISINSSLSYPSAGAQLADGSSLTGQISRTIVSVHVDYNLDGHINMYVYNQETRSFIYIDEHVENYYGSYAYATINKTTPFYTYFLALDDYACAGFDFNTTDDVASQGLLTQQDNSNAATGGTNSEVVPTNQSAGGAGDLSKSDIISIVLGIVVLGLTVLLLLLFYSNYKLRKRNLVLKNNPSTSEFNLGRKSTSDKLNAEADEIYEEQQNNENQNVAVAGPDDYQPVSNENVEQNQQVHPSNPDF